MDQSGHASTFFLIAVIGIIAAIAIPSFQAARDRANALNCLSDLIKVVNGQIEPAEAVCPLNNKPVQVRLLPGRRSISSRTSKVLSILIR